MKKKPNEMEKDDALKGKKILIVDDEADILDTLTELLDMCVVDQASDYEQAIQLLGENDYDAAILDIMGVRGYDLLGETRYRGIPTLILTAHAMDADNFVKAIRSGAQAYIPKEKLKDITVFLNDVLEASSDETKKSAWFKRLENFFEKRFGKKWREREDKAFWEKYFYI